MELFFSKDIDGSICRLDQDESGHCVKVLRHRSGDEISVIDGCGTLYRCRITVDSPKGVEAMVLSSEEGWGGHPYRLHLAVCPTKNNDRYEWFAEKACEIGFDELSPVIGEHSERRVLKTARVEKVLISAAKQSLKAVVPVVNEPVSVKEFIAAQDDKAGTLAFSFHVNNMFNHMYYADAWLWRAYFLQEDAYYSEIGIYPQAPVNFMFKVAYRF